MLWWRLRQLRSKDAKTREKAARKLGESRNPRALKPLMAALKDGVWDVRGQRPRRWGESATLAPWSPW